MSDLWHGKDLLTWWLASIAFTMILCPSLATDGRVNVLLVGMAGPGAAPSLWFDEEPFVDYTLVPCREGMFADPQMMEKHIRLYFPRTYSEMQEYDLIILQSVSFYNLPAKGDKWMHDRIREGAGGYNDGSVMSQVSQIYTSWAQSMTQQAFPNDAPAVAARGSGGVAPVGSCRVVINPNFPDPVLTPFIPYDVEDHPDVDSRFVIAREGAGVVAYQVGNFPGKSDVPWLASWEYGEGRAMTCGGFFFGPFFSVENPYAADIAVNMVLYMAKRPLIDDVDIFHSLKQYFRMFRGRMGYLISVSDFVDKLGANTQGIRKEIVALEDVWRLASDQYVAQDFSTCGETLLAGLDRFGVAEKVAMRVKDAAMWWVYLIEWLATMGTFFVSGVTVWTLMVRRSLYKSVETSRMAKIQTEGE